MGSSSKQSTSIPQSTPQETSLMNEVLNTALPAYMTSLGYATTPTTTTWETSSDYTALNSQLSSLQDQLQSTQSSSPTVKGQLGNAVPNPQIGQIQSEISNVQNQLSQGAANFQPVTTFASVPVANQAVADIVQQYGPDSQQYKDAQAAAIGTQEQTVTDQQQLDQSIIGGVQNIFNGNLSVTPGETQFIQQLVAPYQQAANTTLGYLNAAASNMATSTSNAINSEESSTSQAIQGFMSQVQQTGLSVNNAIGVLTNAVQQGGINMQDALDQQVAIGEQLNNSQFATMTQQEKTQVASQAAADGRSPEDPNFQSQILNYATTLLGQQNTALSEYAAGQSVGIAGQTAQGMEAAANEGVTNAQTTGQGMEQGALMQVQNVQNAGQQGVTQANTQGQVGVEIAQTAGQEANQIAGVQSGETNTLAMLPLSAVGSGVQASSYINSLTQQAASNAGAAVQAPTSIYGTLYNQNYAQPTTTTNQSMGVGGIIGGIVGTGLSAAGTIGGIVNGAATSSAISDLAGSI